jgi:hypothetical protein
VYGTDTEGYGGGDLSEQQRVAKYIIVKASRVSNYPYHGISCSNAGIEPGKLYDTEAEAICDAEKLTAVNPVGFSVQKQKMDGQKK